ARRPGGGWLGPVCGAAHRCDAGGSQRGLFTTQMLSHTKGVPMTSLPTLLSSIKKRLFRTSKPPFRNNRFVPHLEQLDERAVPALMGIPQVSQFGTLFIRADDSNDTMTITD